MSPKASIAWVTGSQVLGLELTAEDAGGLAGWREPSQLSWSAPLLGSSACLSSLQPSWSEQSVLFMSAWGAKGRVNLVHLIGLPKALMLFASGVLRSLPIGWNVSPPLEHWQSRSFLFDGSLYLQRQHM